MKKKLISMIIALSMISMLLNCNIVTHAVSINDSSVFVKQSQGGRCTLASAVMMLRRRAIIDGLSNWSSITESTLSTVAWYSGGLYWNFSYLGMTVGHSDFPSGTSNKKSTLISLLNNHPGGIEVYNSDSYMMHAILITDYDNSTDTFYCADPASGIAAGRIPLNSAYLPGTTQNDKINSLDSYWYITNKSGGNVSPGKPVLKNMKSTYTDEEEISFVWDNTSNTLYYNWYIDEYDASSAGYKGDHYVRIGHEDNVESVKKILPIGKYRVCVTSYNTQHYMDSEWIYFEVISSENFTRTIIRKRENLYVVETQLYNFVDPCNILVAGYKEEKLVALKSEPVSQDNISLTLEGDIDEIKVMAWDGIDNIRPLCEAEEIPSSKWITE